MTDKTTRITLVRHAQSQMNLDRAVIGGRSNHTPLTSAGRERAIALGRELQTRRPPTALAHTSAVRSRQTAQAIMAGARWQTPLILEDGLLELSQGSAEGQPREQWWTPQALAAMRADPHGHRLAPDGESHTQVQARMKSALRRLAGDCPGDHIVAVSHGIAIRTLAWSILGGPHAVFRSLELPNLARLDVDVTTSGDITITARTWAPITPTDLPRTA